jgi:hypothetical protein
MYPVFELGVLFLEQPVHVKELRQPLNHVPDASPKLSRWYKRLCGHKKPGWSGPALR